MISFILLCEANYKNFGGALGKTAANILMPIPASGYVFGPASAKIGEVIGEQIPQYGKKHEITKNIEKMYSTSKFNTNYNMYNQYQNIKDRINHTNKKGGNRLVQTIAGFDPTLGGILISNKLNGEKNG